MAHSSPFNLNVFRISRVFRKSVCHSYLIVCVRLVTCRHIKKKKKWGATKPKAYHVLIISVLWGENWSLYVVGLNFVFAVLCVAGFGNLPGDMVCYHCLDVTSISYLIRWFYYSKVINHFWFPFNYYVR